jgi:hypothetical protein
MEGHDAWTSLEIAKLAVAALTPLLVVAAGFWLNGRLKSLEQAQWSRQKVIERRITAYDELARPLNDLFCFFCYVGSWKELQPSNVVALKRKLDQTAHISAPLFDKDFLNQYNALLDQCFATFGRWGDDAKLRTLPDRRRQAAETSWQEDWDECFAGTDEVTEPEDVKKAYGELMAYLARAIGVEEVDAHLLGSSQIPGNFDMRAAGMVSQIEPPTRDKEF